MTSKKRYEPTDEQLLDYLLMLDCGGAGADNDVWPMKEASPRSAECEPGAIDAHRRAASRDPAVAARTGKAPAARAFPRWFIGAALAGSSMMAHAGSFHCISGSPADCSFVESTLSWDWNGTDFTIFNTGTGYVSEVYFDLQNGMSVTFSGGSGTVSFTAGAQPGSLPGGTSVGFTSDAGFDSDSPGGSQNGIDNGESASFRILGGSPDPVDVSTITAGLHVRSLTSGGASLVSTAGVVTPVPEPETFAMALGGLALVTWASRSRRKT